MTDIEVCVQVSAAQHVHPEDKYMGIIIIVTRRIVAAEALQSSLAAALWLSLASVLPLLPGQCWPVCQRCVSPVHLISC